MDREMNKYSGEGREDPILDLLKRSPSMDRLPEFDPSWADGAPRNRVGLQDLIEKKVGRGTVVRYLPSMAAAAAIFVFVSGLLFYYLRKGEPESPPMAGKVTEPSLKDLAITVKGQVQLFRNEKGYTLHGGDTLRGGDRIVSSQSGEADLLLSSGMTLHVGRGSEFLLETLNARVTSTNEGRIVQIQLVRGSLFSLVQKLRAADSYTIRTPTAIAGVRGTTFQVQTDGKKTGIYLLQGGLEVRMADHPGSSVLLTDREEIHVRPGEEMEKTVLEPERKNSMEKRLSEISILEEKLEPGLITALNQISHAESDEDLERIYNRGLEVVRLRDGRSMRGVVVHQTGNRLIIQTAEGIHVVNSREVQEIRYLLESEVAPDESGTREGRK